MQKFLDKFEIVNFERYNNTYCIDDKTLIFFTDGSCHGNGRKDASGGFASICVNGYKKGLIMYGKVDGRVIPATNIRAEFDGILTTLEFLNKNIKSNKWANAVIYTDSKFWVEMLYKYMPKWSQSKFESSANPDLTKKIWKIWCELQAAKKLPQPKSIEIKHVYAHNKMGGASAEDVFTRFCHDNNDLADMIANIARELPNYKVIKETIKLVD